MVAGIKKMTRKVKGPSKKLQELIMNFESLKAEEARLKARVSKADLALIAQMEEEGYGASGTSIDFTTELGTLFAATYVQGSSSIIDEAQLKKRVGFGVWKKITSTVLDNDKLQHAISSKEVDVNDVAACTTSVDKKPFVRVSKK